MKITSSDAMSLCEHHSHKTGSIGGCLIEIFVCSLYERTDSVSKDCLFLVHVVRNATLKEKYENCKDSCCNLIIFSNMQLFPYSFYLVWFMGL